VTSGATLDIDVDVRREYLFDTVSEPALRCDRAGQAAMIPTCRRWMSEMGPWHRRPW
jgi:hypothetical protein